MPMELLSPAGSIEKLHYAYLYGADAAYTGLGSFSLRARSSNITDQEIFALCELKNNQWKNKKLYGALNAFLHESEIALLRDELQWIKQLPLDALIVSDLGTAQVVRESLPDMALHLSTQANCLNSSAVKAYKSLGFVRVVMGREANLEEIEKIKSSCPDIQIEIFVHGAMCMAYSGRCFLSRWTTGRSANSGDCAHSCRWQYKVLEEEERKGDYFPIEQDGPYTAILSPRDICMIDHLDKIQKAGVDSLKIEGRMKSLYYTAISARAYRKALDYLKDKTKEDPTPYKEELTKVSHRAFSTGFYFNDPDALVAATDSYHRSHQFLGTIAEKMQNGLWKIDVKNQIREKTELEFIGPDVLFLRDSSFELYDEKLEKIEKIDHGKIAYIKTDLPLEPGWIIRGRGANGRGDS